MKSTVQSDNEQKIKKENVNILEFGEYHLRLIKVNDIEAYYKSGFEQLDNEVKYYTGSTGSFTKEQITTYVNTVIENPSRYDFLILDRNKIIGEVVLSEIENNNAHYRICIFNKEYFSKGIGFNATEKLLGFAFKTLGLKSIELEVFPFNDRGIALYKKLGFEITGEIIDEEADSLYKNIYTMKLKVEDFKY